MSRDTQKALAGDDLCIKLLTVNYPRSREARIAKDLVERNAADDIMVTDWTKILGTVARRYKALYNDRRPKRQKESWQIPVRASRDNSTQIQPVKQWPYHLLLVDPDDPDGMWDLEDANLHWGEPEWTFSAVDSLLVYLIDQEGSIPLVAELVAVDLETTQTVKVPFNVNGKIIRRMRLRHRVLIIEWSHDIEGRAPHAVTAIDFKSSSDNNGRLPLKEGEHTPWTLSIRAQWRLSKTYLTSEDRFFSTHNSTHYAVYLWHQKSASEKLMIWELPPSNSAAGDSSLGGQGLMPLPTLLHTWPHKDLKIIWGVAQGRKPSMFSLEIDENTWDPATNSACGQVFVHSEWHPHRHGHWPSADRGMPRNTNEYRVSAIGIPIVGIGPSWQDTCAYEWPRDGPSIGVCPRPEFLESAERWPGRAPCWRHDKPKGLVTAYEVWDHAAGIRFSAFQNDYETPEENESEIQMGDLRTFIHVPYDPDYQSTCSGDHVERTRVLASGRTTIDRRGHDFCFCPMRKRILENSRQICFARPLMEGFEGLMGGGRFEGDERRLVGQSMWARGPRVITF